MTLARFRSGPVANDNRHLPAMYYSLAMLIAPALSPKRLSEVRQGFLNLNSHAFAPTLNSSMH